MLVIRSMQAIKLCEGKFLYLYKKSRDHFSKHGANNREEFEDTSLSFIDDVFLEVPLRSLSVCKDYQNILE